MKKTLKLLLVLVAVVGVFGLTGCGKKKDDLSKYAGTYEGEYSKFVGDAEDAKSTEAFSLELKADGKGVHNRDGASYDVTWSIDGENFKMTEKFLGTIEYNGTLKDGKLVLYNGEATNPFTYQYVYNKK